MRTLVSLALAAALFGAPAAAQTTGVPFINDYTVGGFTSGSTSCTPAPLFGGGLIPFTVTAAPATPVIIFASISAIPGVVCPCVPCTFFAAPSICPIPFTACGGATNQSVDLGLFSPCVLLSVTGVTDAAGTFSVPILLPPFLTFSTQAIVLDPFCASTSLGVVVTQAYDVIT